jgi:hypothetical protein
MLSHLAKKKICDHHMEKHDLMTTEENKQSIYKNFTICFITLLQSILLHDGLGKMYELEIFVCFDISSGEITK